MESKCLISVVVPVYNVKKYLSKCVDTIIHQTYKNIEIILVDDGSTDGSGAKCDEYQKIDSRIKVIHKQNGGLSDARNVGIKNATGKYITFVDSDDYVEYDYIEYLYNLMRKYHTNISFCKYFVERNGDSKIRNQGIDKKCNKIDAFEEILYAKDFEVSAGAKMYLLEHFKDVEFPVGKLFEDNATTYKLIDKNDYVALGYGEKYHYVMRNNSITKKDFNEAQLYLIDASDEMCSYLSKYGELKNAIIRKKGIARISTLNRMINASSRNFVMEKKIRKEILEYKHILIDKKASLRDKLSIVSLIFGIKLYKFNWNFYEKLTGRK